MPLITGISPDAWKDTESMGGFDPCPIGHGLEFVIEKVNADVSKRDPEIEYVTFGCKYVDDDGKGYWIWNYFELTSEKLGFLKFFLEKIGRCDMMLEDSDWEDIIDTEFSSDVSHTKGKDGKTYANFINTSIMAVSHDVFEIPAENGDLEEGDAVDDLDSKIEQEALRNGEEVKQSKKVLKEAKSTEVTDSAPASKASPRRPRRAGAQR